uniref:UBX domain-containing protein 1 n=1 Tax=Cajanus cajan TaxID=3821 RepID=A0A151SMW6_CAJCA|nr:UBX domain-containing protein 1 [Cajanus cajan]
MAGVSLKCGDCGALLRTVEEAQEHAELTSHSNFSESTEPVLNLAVKPISLEAPKVDATSSSENPSAAASTDQNEEMVVPEVDKKLLEELEAMGFSTARATRALHYSGNAGLEAAVSWLVPANTKIEVAKPSLTPDELKAKQQELRERARKKKEEEEKRTEREREKERIRIGKELLEAKRIEEENERKRVLALRKAEKEEERRAREKIKPVL